MVKDHPAVAERPASELRLDLISVCNLQDGSQNQDGKGGPVGAAWSALNRRVDELFWGTSSLGNLQRPGLDRAPQLLDASGRSVVPEMVDGTREAGGRDEGGWGRFQLGRLGSTKDRRCLTRKFQIRERGARARGPGGREGGTHVISRRREVPTVLVVKPAVIDAAGDEALGLQQETGRRRGRVSADRESKLMSTTAASFKRRGRGEGG